MVELGPLLAAWPQKAQFDRAARAMGRAGQGAALWELTELHMEVLSRETATRSELAAAEAEVARLTAEVAQLRAAAPPPPQQPAAPAPPCAAFVRQAPAQQRPHKKQEAQQHKERNGRKRQCISPLDSDVWAFLPPNLL